MTTSTIVHVKMQRQSSSVAWGFRMQGGQEFGYPLQIQKVNPNSLAETAGVLADDFILRIGSVSTEYLTHQQAQDHIKGYSNLLELVLQRGMPPNSADFNRRYDPSASVAPQAMMTLPNNRLLVNQSFNSPIGLYSNDNIDANIIQTLKNMNITSNKTNAPRRSAQRGAKGSALLNQNENINQIAVCFACGTRIRGPFISAMSQCFCVDHFKCSNCSTDLMECGFVEENGKLFCEKDFENLLAPDCAKCSQKILKESVRALEKIWHPECFLCSKCQKSIGTGSFHIEDGRPYCVEDFRRMFQVKCTGCEFPIEAGDKYLEAMGGIYHAECFNCSTCQVCLDGQAFIVKNNRPYCRQHGNRQVLASFR